MPVVLPHVLSGLAGGILRGIVGVYKNQTLQNKKFDAKYFFLTMGISALVGGVAGALADQSWQISFLAGYAGTDFIEGLYKIRMRQRFEI